MNFIKRKIFELLKYQKIGKTNKCEIYSDGVDRHGAFDTNCYVYDAKGKKILKVFNGSFYKRIDDRYFVLLGNSTPDSFFTKEFFIIDEDEGKVVYKSERGDNYCFSMRTGDYHLYIAYKQRRGNRTSVFNLLQPMEPVQDSCYINTIYFHGAGAFEKDDGSFDYIGKHEDREYGIQNCKKIKVVHEGYVYDKAVGIVISCDKNNNLYYMISEEGIELSQPYKHLDGIFNNETRRFFLVGILPSGEIVKVESNYGNITPLETEDLTDFVDGVKFRRAGEIIQLVDKEGNVVLGAMTKLLEDFGEKEIAKEKMAYCAKVVRDGLEYFVNTEGKIYNKYREKWM